MVLPLSSFIVRALSPFVLSMRSRNRIFGAASLLILLAFAPRAWARSGAPAQQQAPAPPAESQQEQPQQSNQSQVELMRALNLTPEQRAQIAQIRQETEGQARQVNVRLRRARRALEQAIYAGQADESVIQQRAREVADAEAARVQMRADAELKVRRVLNSEQLATFRQLRRQAQLARQRQDALGNAANNAGAQRPGAPAQQRNAARAADAPARPGGSNAPVPSLFPRRQRQQQRQPARRPVARP
jgi:Spy/CpxP family protein refolding chaperone